MAGNEVIGEKTVVLAIRLVVDGDATTESLTDWLVAAMPHLRGDTGQIQDVRGVLPLTNYEWAAVGGKTDDMM